MAQLQEQTDRTDATRTGLRDHKMGGYHQPVQKGHTGWRLKKNYHLRIRIDGILTGLPVLECGARNPDLFSQVTVTAKGGLL